MISRIWHGWTTPENADRYESLLKTEMLLRRVLEREVGFITVMWFESWEAVKEFAGDHLDHAVVPPKARPSRPLRRPLSALRGARNARA